MLVSMAVLYKAIGSIEQFNVLLITHHMHQESHVFALDFLAYQHDY